MYYTAYFYTAKPRARVRHETHEYKGAKQGIVCAIDRAFRKTTCVYAEVFADPSEPVFFCGRRIAGRREYIGSCTRDNYREFLNRTFLKEGQR